MTRPLGFLLTLAGLLMASETSAKHIFQRGGSPRGVVSTPSSNVVSGPSNSQGTSYSDYNTFTYVGHSHGHPYGPWTWPSLSGSYGQGLARYYDPPVK